MGNLAKAYLIYDAKETFLQGLLKFEKSGDFTVFTIACGDREWKVHRVVICSHSKYFWKTCQSGFKEGETGAIVLKEENPAVIAKLVNYFYKFDYDDSDVKDAHSDKDNREQPPAQDCKPSKLEFNALMYFAGDKYDIGGLKILAKAKFSAALVQGWDQEDHFPEAIRLVYENTVSSDRGLRECLKPMLVVHKQQLQSNEKFMDLVETNGKFARDLIPLWTRQQLQLSYGYDLQAGPSSDLAQVANSQVSQTSLYDGAGQPTVLQEDRLMEG
ncbi:MAG: hypothetical protein Q9198_003517 [Flavoplaca austrocitrina]